jgi:methionyl-tRNA formyltransferase
MKLFLIIDETHFYQPNFVAELINKTDHEIVGAALVTKVLPKSDLERYMIRNFLFLRFSELVKLGTKKLSLQLKNRFQKKSKGAKTFYSVRKVYEHFNIEYFEVEYDINKPVYLNKIKEKQPDIIVSSNSTIFGDELLNIPKYCINRHSALLPSYGGLWPVFQAVRKNEKKVGVSVHTMEKKIDKGILLSQTVVPIEKGDTVDTLYQKCFQCSADTVLNAIKKIDENDVTALKNNCAASYYSFPKKYQWKQFRKTKIKFI